MIMDFAERCMRWRNKGILYGYPECCIDSFLTRSQRIADAKDYSLESAQERCLDGNGFIPCAACARKLLDLHGHNAPDHLSDLITNRQAPKEYPIDDVQVFKKRTRFAWAEHCDGVKHHEVSEN